MTTNVLALGRGQSEPTSPNRDAGELLKGSRLLTRAAVAGMVIAAEVLLIAALGHPWLETHQLATAPIAFATALLFFGRKRLKEAAAEMLPERERSVARWVVLHGAALAAMVALEVWMYRSLLRGERAGVAAVGLWCATLPVLFGSVLLVAVDARRLRLMARRLGAVWVYASVCALLAVFFRAAEYVAWDAPSSWLGNALAGYAFAGVRWMLGIFYTGIEADAATRVLGMPAFRIHVAGTCSGVEGLGLTLALTLGWIVYERRRLRVARALLLVPVALCVMWVLNLLRMTALVAIGLAGYRQLALTGFHTEAGWIAFAMVSVGFLVAADRVGWLRLEVAEASRVEGDDSAAVAYVLPFVAVLGTSLVTRVFSTIGFEVLYPLRLVVCAAVLVACRKVYASLQWKAGWLDVGIGLLVGAVWAYVARGADGGVIREGLAVLGPGMRGVWLVCRVVAAVVTVPLAEELAFRGFLARWLVSQRFESMRYAGLGVWSVVVSSLAFGGMHGGMWAVGMASGVVFAWLAKRRDSLGSAVVAHAAANAVLAILAMTRGMYGLW